MKTITLSPEELFLFKQKVLEWAVSFETACYLNSNSYTDPYGTFDLLIAAGSVAQIQATSGEAFNQLNTFLTERQNKWTLGYFGYDLKNELEDLDSSNKDLLSFPDLFFFEPIHLLLIKGNTIAINSPNEEFLFQEIISFEAGKEAINLPPIHIKTRFTYEEYCATIEAIRAEILKGNIYEMNFCQEFYAEDVEIAPLKTFETLNNISPTPFSSFFKFDNNYIISATPERFLCKRGSKLCSQPIKGTAKRSSNPLEDTRLKQELQQSVKEQSENVMIVDLVRNDLTKVSIPASVKVEELFGIYSFKQVHQMISTVVSEANPNLNNFEIIKAAFPMGSMTGAPKVKAMQLIERFERSKRGTFSGALGYFAPNGDFDFNVVIRTILYNSNNKYLSFQVGGAITYASDAKKEYEECLLKAEAILKILS